MMGQSMHGWKADDFFMAVKQQLDHIHLGRIDHTLYAIHCAAATLKNRIDQLDIQQVNKVLQSLQLSARMIAAPVKNRLEQLDVDQINKLLQSLQSSAELATGTFKNHIEQINPEQFDATFRATQNLAEAVTDWAKNFDMQSLTNSIKMAKGALLFNTLAIAGSIFAGGIILKDISRSLEKLLKCCEIFDTANQVHQNLSHQESFATMVYNLVRMHLKLHTGKIGSRQHLSSKDENSAKVPSHHVFVYHPGNDWYGAFYRLEDEDEVGVCESTKVFDDWDRLLHHLHTFRQTVGQQDTFHILLPSAHKYDIHEGVYIPSSLLLLRIWGQTNHTGTPYCRARITGLGASDVINIGSLPGNDTFEVYFNMMQLITNLSIDAFVHLMLFLVLKLLGLGVSFNTYFFMAAAALFAEHAELGLLLREWLSKLME